MNRFPPQGNIGQVAYEQVKKEYKNNWMIDIDVNEAISTVVPTPLNIETYTGGIAQVETATVTSTDVVTADPGGTAVVTVTAANMTGSPVAVDVPLLLNDDANAIATKIREALTANETVAGFFTISGANNNIIVTVKTNAENDSSMNVAIATGTATGVTAKAASADTTKGSLNEICHPSILFFPNKWNGYRYWMAYTPYDNGDPTYENPCIAVSNDNITWVTPPGLTNPVFPVPTTGYNADPHLFMSPDGNIMYLMFKVRDGSKKIVVSESQNGANWSDYVIVIEAPEDGGVEELSPSVVWDGSQYVMWAVHNDAELYTLHRRTATSPYGPWSNSTLCTHNISGMEIWHGEVRKVMNQYHMIIMTRTVENATYLGKSADGISWEFAKNPLFRRGNYGTPSYGFYKSTFWPMLTDQGVKYGIWYGTAPTYFVYYSEITFERTQLIKERNNNILQAIVPLKPWIMADTFTRDDSAESLGIATTGQAWTSLLGKIGISSNQAYLPAATGSWSVIDTGVADYYVEAEIATISNGDWGLIFRCVDINNMWRILSTYNSLVLYKRVGGVNTGTYLKAGCYMASGDVLGVKCDGDDITIYVNGRVVDSFTSSVNNTGTKVGLSMSDTTQRFENIVCRGLYY